MAQRTLRGQPRPGLAVLCVLSLLHSSCILQHVEIRALPAPVTVKSPVKAHLKDGSTVVFTRGVVVEGATLRGDGRLYDLTLTRSEPVQELPVANVAAMESFRDETTGPGSAVLSFVGLMVGGLLYKAVFGSCPTVYSVDDGSRLEAETFSYSIVPLFEGRDLDRLSTRPGTDGRLRLEIRNEALETHYINHLQLVAVDHGPTEMAIPDQAGLPVVVSALRGPARAVSRSGRDVRAALAQVDDRAGRTDEKTLAAAGGHDLDDWIDLTLPGPRRADRVALVLRARSGLVNTVLFYDVMLAGAGVEALNWLGDDLDKISGAVEMGRWARQRMGLRVAIGRGDGYEEVARVPDPGPIAWHDVAAVIPWPEGETDLRVRLSFVADAWRFDRVALGDVREARVKTIPVGAVTGQDGAAEEDALAALREPDGRYLQTSPGQRFQVRFDVGPGDPGSARTFLLSSQGYYTEWIRGSWLQSTRAPKPFKPSDEALAEALRLWKAKRATFERDFERRRVAVR